MNSKRSCRPLANLMAATLLSAAQPMVARAESSVPTLEPIVVTARLRQEDPQNVPISLSVVNAATLESTRTNNIAEMALLVPSLNYVSPNPRNTAFTIRGLGSSVRRDRPGQRWARTRRRILCRPGLSRAGPPRRRSTSSTSTGSRCCAVRRARCSARTRRPVRSTSAARRRASTPRAAAELAVGDHGYFQAKASATGPLARRSVAGRLSAATTAATACSTMSRPAAPITTCAIPRFARPTAVSRRSRRFRLRLIADYSSFDSHCCTQVYFAVGTTLKPAGAAVSGARGRRGLRSRQPRSL